MEDEHKCLLGSQLPLNFLGSSDCKESVCNAGNPGLIPGSGRTPAEGNGNPLQYSCLENSMDRGAWQATVHGVSKSQTGLSDYHFTFTFDYFYNQGMLESLIRE